MGLTHEKRQLLRKTAENKDIIDVAQSLGMDLVKQGRHYIWSEHDSFVLNGRKNLFYWNSRQEGGSTIQLVQLIKECSYKEAVNYLNNVDNSRTINPTAREEPQKPFYYYLKDVTTFTKARDYLVNVRKLNPEIVDKLYNEGYLSQSMYMPKYPESKHLEPCIVAKWRRNEKLVGGTIQGLIYNPEEYGKRGRDKKIMGNVERNFGFNYVIGQPTKIIFAESFIDLLSYWSLHPELDNCMLADLEGLKHNSMKEFIKCLVNEHKGTIEDGVVVAVDNDSAGQNFVDKLSEFQFSMHENYQLAQPYNNAVLKEHMSIYQIVAEEYNIDPLAIATVHKAFTNGSSTNKLANYWENDQFFGKKLKPKEEPEPINIFEESKKVAKELSLVKINMEQYDFGKLVIKGKENLQTIGMRDKLIRLYNMYKSEGVDLKETIIKDQNDLLKEKVKSNQSMNTEKVGGKMEKTNDFFLEFNYTLEDTLKQMEDQPEGTTNYLTEEAVTQLLNEHLDKVEQLFTHFQSSYDLLPQPTKQEANKLKDGLVKTVELTNKEAQKTLTESLAETKKVSLFNVKEKTNQLRIKIKNTFNKPILKLNAKIKQFVEKIDKNFALEVSTKEEKLKEEDSTLHLPENETDKVIVEDHSQELVTNVQKYIEINDRKETVQQQIKKEIQKNPLAPINELQKELEYIQNQLIQTEKIINKLNPVPNPNSFNELTSLVKKRDRLQEERKKIVNHPNFLRSKEVVAGTLSPLEAFRKVDQELMKIEKKINNIEQGVLNEPTTKKEFQETIDPFDIASSPVKQDANEKNQSLQATIPSKDNNEATKQIKETMEKYFSSTNIKPYLDSMHKFHDYSPKNIQLIMKQAPNATQVASKSKWEKLDYTLKENAQPIKIYQPIIANDKIIDYHPIDVYDVSQTTNETLKHNFIHNVSERDSFLSVYQSIEELTNTKIDFQSLGEAKSHYDSSTNTLIMNTGLGREETIKTIIKETIPQYINYNYQSKTEKPNQFEAEALSYVIASHVGLDTSELTFESVDQLKVDGYPIEKFTQSLNRCSKHATKIINKIDQNYEKALNLNNKTNKFDERLSQAKTHTREVNEQLKSQDQTLEQKTTIRL